MGRIDQWILTECGFCRQWSIWETITADQLTKPFLDLLVWYLFPIPGEAISRYRPSTVDGSSNRPLAFTSAFTMPGFPGYKLIVGG